MQQEIQNQQEEYAEKLNKLFSIQPVQSTDTISLSSLSKQKQAHLKNIKLQSYLQSKKLARGLKRVGRGYGGRATRTHEEAMRKISTEAPTKPEKKPSLRLAGTYDVTTGVYTSPSGEKMSMRASDVPKGTQMIFPKKTFRGAGSVIGGVSGRREVQAA